MTAPFCADLAELADIPPSERGDGVPYWVAETRSWYAFNAADTSAAEAGLVIVPTTGTGRFRLASHPQPVIAAKPITLTDAGLVAIDAQGSSFELTMAQTRATRLIGNPTSIRDGQHIEIWIHNPGTALAGGGWPTFTLGTIWVPRSGVLDIATGANATTLLQGRYLASKAKIYCEVGGRWV